MKLGNFTGYISTNSYRAKPHGKNLCRRDHAASKTAWYQSISQRNFESTKFTSFDDLRTEMSWERGKTPKTILGINRPISETGVNIVKAKKGFANLHINSRASIFQTFDPSINYEKISYVYLLA